jgi:hypothetical protein
MPQIFTIWGSIGLKDDGLQTGLKNARAQATGLKRGLNDVVQGLTGFSIAGLAGAGAVVALTKGLKESIDYTVALGKQTRDLSRDIGATSEQASGLIEVAGDVKIGYEELSTAMRMAINKGNAPTIEGLRKMSDAYRALPAGIMRTKYLLENFGRSGARMGALMELTGDQLTAMFAEAEAGGKVLSTQGVADLREYEKTLEGVSDIWEAFKIKIGLGATRSILAMAGNEEIIASMKKQDTTMQGMGKYYSSVYTNVQPAVVGLTSRIDQLAESEKVRLGNTKKQALTTEELATAQEKYNDSLVAERDIQKQRESSYAETKTGAATGMAGYLEQAGVSADKYRAGLAAIDRAQGSGLLKAYDYEQAQKKLAKQFAMGTITAEEFEIQQKLLTTGFIGIGNTAGYAGDKVKFARMEIEALKSKEITVKIYTENATRAYRQDLGYAGAAPLPQGPAPVAPEHGRAGGGDVMAGRAYMVGERGPEMIIPRQSGYVVPNDKLKSVGGITLRNYGNMYFQSMEGLDKATQMRANSR